MTPSDRSPRARAGAESATVLRLAWLTIALSIVTIYLLTGGPWRLAALLPLLLAASLLVYRTRAGRQGPLEQSVVWPLIGLAVILAGALMVMGPTSPGRQAHLARSEQDRLQGALVEVRHSLEAWADQIEASLNRPLEGRRPGERLTQAWEAGRRPRWRKSAAVALFPGGREPALWAGSAWTVPDWIPPPGWSGPVGDSLAAYVYTARDLPSGRLIVGTLLARQPGEAGPAPGTRPALEYLLPYSLTSRLRLQADLAFPPESVAVHRLCLQLDPRPEGRGLGPLPRALQAALLLAAAALVVLLLVREDTPSRGLIAAPLLYATAVPLLTGAYAFSISPALLKPSWAGQGLINQAFLAVAIAGLSLWFALRQHNPTGRSSQEQEPLPAVGSPRAGLLLLVQIPLWGVGLGLLQDLYRFAPVWFWAHTRILPGGRDLVGWLIAVAMTLSVIGLSAGISLRGVRRGNRGGLIAAAALAAAGGLLAAWIDAWHGRAVVGALVAGIGTLAAAGWLQAGRKPRDPLAVLLGLGLLGAAVHLPVKWELSGLLARQVIAETAEGLASAGVDLEEKDVQALRIGLRTFRDHQAATPQPASAGIDPGAGWDRQAYLLWRQLPLGRWDLGSGVQFWTESSGVLGRFGTVAGLFEGEAVEHLQTRSISGGELMLLAAGAPGFFGEETLWLALPPRGEATGIQAGVRRRPLAFLSDMEERLWSMPDRSGIIDRSGRLAGTLYLRIFDEGYHLLEAPLNPALAPAAERVPPAVAARLAAPGTGGSWHRSGFIGGGQEYYFWIEAPSVHPPVPGGAVLVEAAVERRIASLGYRLPGLWGRIVEGLSLLVLFEGMLLLLVWLPAAGFASPREALGSRLRRLSFRNRLLIPLLVVALVPLAALWLMTRGFVLQREAAAWEEGLHRGLNQVPAALERESRQWAEQIGQQGGVRLTGRGGGAGLQWARFDANLNRREGNLSEALAVRIPLREVVLGRGPSAFIVRGDNQLWSAAVAPMASGYGDGAVLVLRPLSEEVLASAAAAQPWELDLFLDGRLMRSTEPAPYAAGWLPHRLPPEADLYLDRSPMTVSYRWGEAGGMRYLLAWQPLTDYSGAPAGMIVLRRFGLWGLSDPAMAQLFSAVATLYLLLVGAVTGVAILVARRISGPIGSLTASARRVSGGDLEVAIPVTRGDEVGGLQKAFRQMVIALRENRDRLAQAERERAWQQMARQVAHEIKNPLTPMQLSAQFLRKAWQQQSPDLDTILPTCTDAIVEQVEELRRIASEFSAYARLPMVRREPARLNAPIEEALQLFLPALPDGVTVRTEWDPDMPPVPLDAEQVRRVAINLVRNALDAVGSRGTLTLRSGHDRQTVWFQVADTGEGIAPEVQERLFEPYFSTKTDGTGLGLAITRSIVEAHGGTIAIQSEAGQGTTVTAHFPRGQ